MDEMKKKLLETYPPELADRVLAFQRKGDSLSSRRKILISGAETMPRKLWKNALKQIEDESRAHAQEGEKLKSDMGMWLQNGEI